ncbi:hypothetical protein ACVIIW_004418 [Bradyrhizobium sp. USDA 4449]
MRGRRHICTERAGRRPSRLAEETRTSSDNDFVIARGWRYGVALAQPPIPS